MNKFQIFMKAHSSTILTVVGSVGVITTAGLSIKGTIKASKLIERYHISDSKEHKKELLKEILPYYIPAVISGLLTISCVYGSNYLSYKKQKNLISSYMLLDKTFKEYRKQMEEKHEETEETYDEINKKQIDENENETMFFEFNSMRFFEANVHKVMAAECKTREQYEKYGQVSLNDYYSYIGLSPTAYGEVMGWSKYQVENVMHEKELNFKYERTVMSNGLVCYCIITNVDPTDDYFVF